MAPKVYAIKLLLPPTYASKTMKKESTFEWYPYQNTMSSLAKPGWKNKTLSSTGKPTRSPSQNQTTQLHPQAESRPLQLIWLQPCPTSRSLPSPPNNYIKPGTWKT